MSVRHVTIKIKENEPIITFYCLPLFVLKIKGMCCIFWHKDSIDLVQRKAIGCEHGISVSLFLCCMKNGIKS